MFASAAISFGTGVGEEGRGLAPIGSMGEPVLVGDRQHGDVDWGAEWGLLSQR